jgi:AraC-like DNA-binding protein
MILAFLDDRSLYRDAGAEGLKVFGRRAGRDFASRSGQVGRAHQRVNPPDLILDAFRRSPQDAVCRVQVSGNRGLAAQAHAALLRLLARFLPAAAPALTQELAVGEKYQDLLAYCQANARLGLRPAEIAAGLHAAPLALARSFRRDTGQTLKQYLSAELCKKVKDRLLLSNDSVKEIAAKFQFSDEFYLSRFFKKREGLSPTAYRRQNRVP